MASLPSHLFSSATETRSSRKKMAEFSLNTVPSVMWASGPREANNHCGLITSHRVQVLWKSEGVVFFLCVDLAWNYPYVCEPAVFSLSPSAHQYIATHMHSKNGLKD